MSVSHRPGRLFPLALGALTLIAACGAAPLDAITVDPGSLVTDLVAHWTFDEGTGTVVGDHSGNGHDGVLTGGTWVTGGRFGGGLELAQGDFVTVSGFPQATANWTVSVWTKTSEAQLVADMSDGETILSTENVFQGGWQMHLDNRPGFAQFDAAYWAGPNPNDYVVANCGCIEANRWIHLTAVFDDDVKLLTLYRDGGRVDQRGMPSAILPGDTTLYLGTWNMKARFLAGVLDDFAVWSRALGPGEVALLSMRSPGS